jgi:hypothetical protein
MTPEPLQDVPRPDPPACMKTPREKRPGRARFVKIGTHSFTYAKVRPNLSRGSRRLTTGAQVGFRDYTATRYAPWETGVIREVSPEGWLYIDRF